MRPYPEEILRAIQTGIGAHFAPEVKSTYGQAQFAFSMLLFTLVQRDYDTAVPDLVDANAALRDVIGAARAALAAIDRADVRQMRGALTLPEPAPTLRLSALRAENEALRTLLCTLAPLIEPAEDDSALTALRPVRRAIYAHLAADARRRIFPILTAG